MKARSVHVRINRLVIDAALAEGIDREELGAALQAAMTSALGGGAAPASRKVRTAPSSGTSPVAGAVAEGIAGRLAATKTSPEVSSKGGRHG